MGKKAVSRENWLLVVIDEGMSLSPAQLQKSLFLLHKNHLKKVKNFYKFEPYAYGPFDADIYGDAHVLMEQELINIDNPMERGWRRYRITDTGNEAAAIIREKLDEKDFQAVSDAVDFVKTRSFSTLVRDIYQMHPEFKVNSVFKS